MSKPSKIRASACPSCGGRVYLVNGTWLRAQRVAAGVSVRSFARSLDFSAAYISDIERNHRGCSHEIQVAYERLTRGE
jgi:hypothetical protein